MLISARTGIGEEVQVRDRSFEFDAPVLVGRAIGNLSAKAVQ
jgi:hypothetical protein